VQMSMSSCVGRCPTRVPAISWLRSGCMGGHDTASAAGGLDNAGMEANGLPSRTSILTAAGRALGSREPDPSVRNPDWIAARLIGPGELALIADHPISRAFDGAMQDAMNDPDVFGFTWLMLVRTRHIDAMLERAV